MLGIMDSPTAQTAAVGAGTISPPAGRLPPDDSRMPRVLCLDAHGRILNWLHWQDAACLYARDAVSWTLGEPCLTIHGGRNRLTGEQSLLALHPIVAARGQAHARGHLPSPALTNTALFARDKQLCLYCGKEFSRHVLTRDRLLPLQFQEGRTHAPAGRYALAGSALPAELGGAPDSLQPQHPGRPDGLPQAASAQAPARRRIRHSMS